MCGLAGILRITPPRGGGAAGGVGAIPDEWLACLDARLVRRGPDGAGRFRDRVVRPDGAAAEVALVHRRLSVLDLTGGAQPMSASAADGRAATVVFNGCIYNHRALRAGLSGSVGGAGGGGGGGVGQRFDTDNSDTEVIPRLWLARGAAGLAELEGMFALALWDHHTGTLALARDRFGEKPLYVARAAGRGGGGGEVDGQPAEWVVFSSEPAGVARVLARITGRSPRVEPAAMAAWLGWGFHPLRTPWSGIDALPPGVARVYTPRAAGGEPEAVDVPLAKAPGLVEPGGWGGWGGLRGLGGRDAAGSRPLGPVLDEIERVLALAVADRLEADVPLACFLSGGVDSSLVTLLAQRASRAAGGRGGGGVTAITVRTPDPSLDETEFARAAARAIGCRHVVVDASPRAAEDLVALIAGMGLPFGDSSLLPTHWVSRATRQAGFAVALTGDGGDELFLGYERYAAARWLPWLVGLPLVSVAGGWLSQRWWASPSPRRRKLARLGGALQRRDYAEVLALWPESVRRRLVDATPDGVMSCPVRSWRGDGAREARAWELGTVLPGDYLRKVDSAAMHVALETRAPMLAPALAELALNLPVDLVRSGGRKGLLRALARRHLPAGVIDRPKRGLAVPIGRWFREDFGGLGRLLRDRLSGEGLRPLVRLGVPVDVALVERVVAEHLAGGGGGGGGAGGGGAAREHDQRLFGLLAASIWAAEVAEPIERGSGVA